MPVPIFDAPTRAILVKMADYYLPSVSPDTGKKLYDIVNFLETFLSAFDQDPPRIFAGGPFSDRHPSADVPAPANDFQSSLPLTRYQRLAWQLRLNGPKALAGEPFIVLSDDLRNNYTGLRDVLTTGLTFALRLANDVGVKRGVMPAELFWAAGPDFRQVFPGLLCEAAFSAPEYGGNLATWPEVFYPGDSLPAGYTPAQVANSTPDPFPTETLAAVLLDIANILEA